MKAEEREAKRLEAERKNAPIHALLILNNMCVQIVTGLKGGAVVSGVTVPALHMNEKHAEWCLSQLGKVIRWTAACLEERGFGVQSRIPAGVWNTALRKVNLICQAVDAYAKESSYQDVVIIQLVVAEMLWQNIMLDFGIKGRSARYLSQTLATFTDRFTDGEDQLSVLATDVYMATNAMLDGSVPLALIDFTKEKAWSAA